MVLTVFVIITKGKLILDRVFLLTSIKMRINLDKKKKKKKKHFQPNKQFM